MADTATEIAIATQTLSSAASTITFSSIAATYTDLRLVLTCTTTAGADAYFRFNGDSATNYSYTYISGNGTTATSSYSTSSSTPFIDVNGISTTIPSLFTFDIFSYAGSTYKTSLITGQEDRNGSGAVSRTVSLWRSTAAITSVALTANGTTFAIGTTATLYGIL